MTRIIATSTGSGPGRCPPCSTGPGLSCDGSPARLAAAVGVVDIIARTAVSCDERPITVSGAFKAEPGSEFEQTLQDFHAYGAPFTSPPGAYEGHIDAPGGLGGAIAGGSARVTAADGKIGEDPDLVVQVIDPDRNALGAVILHRVERTSGGQGVRVVLKERHGIFTLEDRYNLSTMRRLRTLTIGDVIGKPISAVHAALHFLTASHEPNWWRLSRPNTPPELGTVDKDIGLVWPDEQKRSLDELLGIVDELYVIQSHTTAVLTFPDLETVGSSLTKSWRLTAGILRGETLVMTYP